MNMEGEALVQGRNFSMLESGPSGLGLTFSLGISREKYVSVTRNRGMVRFNFIRIVSEKTDWQNNTHQAVTQ
jgi:hypothetical protein